MNAIPSRLGTFRRIAGWAALFLATASWLCALTIRDAIVPSAIFYYGIPWLLRIGLVAAAYFLLRPIRPRCLMLAILITSLLQGGLSFRVRHETPATAGSFKVCLWNAGRKLTDMPNAWPTLVDPETKLVVLVESGSFPADAWQRFTDTHPDLSWKQLEGGIVVGVRGKIIDTSPLGDQDRFRCHRVRVELDGIRYNVFAIDIPSQPWLPRQPYLDRIRSVAANERCLILGDFNTPPSARGYDAWRERFDLANDSGRSGFQETWLYGLPLLTLDQLWLSKDLRNLSTTNTPTLRSDHDRMNFEVAARK